MKNILKWIILIVVFFYVLICIGMFSFQESFIFFPEKLENDYSFNFDANFEEHYVYAEDGVALNALLFKADSSKGLIFYLHGNAGSLRTWGSVADFYLDLGYDIFILDYRGFGKTKGKIKNQKQFFSDAQVAYDYCKNKYNENRIIILGYSIGTAPASKLASENMPKKVILQAPFYSLVNIMKKQFPIIPTFLLKYKFENGKYLQKSKVPIIIFHGDNDKVISYKESLALKNDFKLNDDRLYILKNQGHNGMTYNNDYKDIVSSLLK